MGCLKPWPCVLLTRVEGGPATRFQMRHLSDQFPSNMNESQTSCLKYKIYQCAFRCSSPWKERLHSPYEKVGPNLGCCTFQIEVMINAIHFWDLILFKFFLITTIGSWNIVLVTVVKMIIKWKKFQSLSPGQKGWKVRSGRNIRGIHSWTTDFSNSDLMINSTGSASEIWCRQNPTAHWQISTCIFRRNAQLLGRNVKH